MGYTLKNKNINIGKLPLLSTNNTGKSYKLNSGIALKIFKENFDNKVISEEECSELSEIRCDRILMPKNSLYKDGDYVGYSFQLLHNRSKNKRLSLLERDELVTNLDLIEDDINNLSKNHVVLDGINPKNLIYCNGLYIPDVSEFKILNDEVNPKYIKRLNFYELSLLFSNLLESDLKKDKNIDEDKIEYLIDLLNLRDDDYKLSEYFDELLSDSENISQFVKKI